MAKDISDVLPQGEMLEGEKIDKEELVGKKFEITKFVLLPSSFEGSTEFAVVQIRYEGKFRTFNVSDTMTKTLAMLKDELPVSAKLAKIKSKKHKGREYFSFVSAK